MFRTTSRQNPNDDGGALKHLETSLAEISGQTGQLIAERLTEANFLKRIVQCKVCKMWRTVASRGMMNDSTSGSQENWQCSLHTDLE